VRFGLLKTLFYAFEVCTHLPTRLNPQIVQVPASGVEKNGTQIVAFTHIDQETSERQYSYNIVGSDIVTVLDPSGYNIIKAWNAAQKTMISASQFNLEYRDKTPWSSGQLRVAILACTYETGHTDALAYTRAPSVFHYRFKPTVFEEVKPAMTEYFAGCTRGCTYVPMRTRGNTEHGCKTRIEDVRPVGLDESLSRYQQACVNAFIGEYRKTPGFQVQMRWSQEQVMEKQTKPGQRLTNAEALNITDIDYLTNVAREGKKTESFQKTEAAMKAGDPRNITPMPPKVRLGNSRISMPLAVNCKKTNWYSFGLTPAQVAVRVASHVSDPTTEFIALGDYSRMDGTINHLVREFDLAFLKANFHPSEHDEIEEWYKQTYDNDVKAGQGYWYKQGTSQGSGCPYTSVLNTARNAFITFCCLRRKLTAEGAYQNLGPMAGDDSLQRNIDKKSSIATALTWGFILKFVLVQRGERVDFLAREYSPAVWFGATDNICSPLRMLSKFHVSGLSNIIPAPVIAYMKASSILANDSLTYIVGPWMRKIVDQTRLDFTTWNSKASKGLKLLGEQAQQWNEKWAASFGDLAATSYQVGNTNGTDWQKAVFLEQFDGSALDNFEAWAANPSNRWDECPVLLERQAKPRNVPYMANGNFVGPTTTEEKIAENKGNDGSNAHSSYRDVHTAPSQTPVKSGSSLSNHKTILQLTPLTPQTPSCEKPEAEEESKENKSTTSLRLCKRGDQTNGWYAGLQPCTTVLAPNSKHAFCRPCHLIYRREMAKENSST
jgi:hypothetical protein